MQVVATATGLAGIVRNPGDVFPCPKDAKGNEITKSQWYKVVQEGETPPARVEQPLDSTGRGQKQQAKQQGGKSLV